MKYPPSMDSETRVFVDTTSSFYSDDREDFTIGEMRDNYDALCAHFARPFPDGVTAHDRLIGDVPLRHYSISDNPPARLVYIHGGGFVVETNSSGGATDTTTEKFRIDKDGNVGNNN